MTAREHEPNVAMDRCRCGWYTYGTDWDAYALHVQEAEVAAARQESDRMTTDTPNPGSDEAVASGCICPCWTTGMAEAATATGPMAGGSPEQTAPCTRGNPPLSIIQANPLTVSCSDFNQ